MSEPFRVPERLQLAIRPGRGDEPFRSVMDVVDVPALCRAEVERAWHWWHESDAEGTMPLEASFVDYLAARFPEAPPETCPEGGTCDGHPCAGCGRKRPVGARPEAEDRLHPMTSFEREFVRALALWAKANVPKEYRDVHYAARRLLEAE